MFHQTESSTVRSCSETISCLCTGDADKVNETSIAGGGRKGAFFYPVRDRWLDQRINGKTKYFIVLGVRKKKKKGSRKKPC